MYPFVVAAALIALWFIAATFRRRRPAEFLAALLWSAYAVYEYFIANGTLCDANCNIRIDLLLFLPILGVASWLAMSSKPRTGAATALAAICLLLAASIAWALGSTLVAAAALLATVTVVALWAKLGRGA